VANDEVGPDVRQSLERVVDALGMSDVVLKRAGAKVRFFPRAAERFVVDAFESAELRVGQLGDVGGLPLMLLHKPLGDMAKLSGEVFVDEKDVHGRWGNDE
jgi:hypothetical protein